MEIELSEMNSNSVSEPAQVASDVRELGILDLVLVSGGMRPIGLITIDK